MRGLLLFLGGLLAGSIAFYLWLAWYFKDSFR